MQIEIGSIGYNHKHDKNFFMDFPGGPGAFLLLLIKADSIFKIKRKSYNVQKNSFILLNPDTPCTYKGAKDIYADDWCFLGIDNEGKTKLEKMGITLDTPVYLQNIESLSDIIHKIAFEFYSSDIYHNELKDKYTEIFFLELARIINSRENISPHALTSKNERLTYLKIRLFREPDFFSGIDDMAEYMYLSRSGFQHLYKSVFGHNVMIDIIAGRIERSKDLLKNTKLTVAEIATKVGYKTEYHFMRQFKEHTGMTPTQFRKQPR